MLKTLIYVCTIILSLNVLSLKGDFCQDSNPCKNGGKCITQTGLYGFSCNCPSPYYGTTCELSRNSGANVILGSDGFKPSNSGSGSGSGSNWNPKPAPINPPPKPSNDNSFGGNPNFPFGNNNNQPGSINIGNNKPASPGSINIPNSPNNYPNAPGSINIGYAMCTPTSCLNNGVCRPYRNSFQCQCYGNYYGDRCQYYNQRNRSFLGWILGSLLPFLFFVAIIGLCIYCCCFRKRSANANNTNRGGFMGQVMNLPSVFSNRQPKPQGQATPAPYAYTPAPVNLQDPEAAFRVNQQPPPYETLYTEQRPLNK